MLSKLFDRANRLVDDFLHIGNTTPRDWYDRDRLATWECQHQDAASGVWAVLCRDGRWELHAPGSPDPTQWPSGPDPYAGPPVDARLAPAGSTPQLDYHRTALCAWVARHSCGCVIESTEGIRWFTFRGEDVGDPIMFFRVVGGHS